MKEQRNIICLYWVGDFRGRDFTESDVWRLFNNVSKHMNSDFTFYTLTNDMSAYLPGHKIELEYNWPGWWSKMELHRPDLPKGRTLYLDLDTTVVTNIDEVFDVKGNLVMFNNRMIKKPRPDESWKIVYRYQAAIMLFDPGSTVEFYNMFLKDPQRYIVEYRSEQDLMGEFLPNQPTFPDKWLMKLASLRTKAIKPWVKFVTGQPKGINFRNPEYAKWIHLKV
jgi:hypothetical protein